MSEDFASFTGFEVAAGDPLASARASADLGTLGAGSHHVATMDEHAAPLHTPGNGRGSDLALA